MRRWMSVEIEGITYKKNYEANFIIDSVGIVHIEQCIRTDKVQGD